MKHTTVLLGAILAFAGFSAFAQDTTGIPEIRREARGVWVATVGNIDWPSKPGLSTDEQKQEAIAILDKCVELKMNQVIYQVRPACDALYDSKLEPWSEYLTGEQGKAPDPYYDPLQFWVEEAHKRGLEVHCWFNPYRARLIGKKDKVTAENHISKTHPEVVKTYGAHQWMDPGEKLVQQQTIDVVMDVVKRYDVDGIHMDDYFYPYPIQEKVDGKSQDVPFPDDASWEKYTKGGGTLERDDWRRDNVNKLVEKLYKSIKAEKPHVKFGLSPFGIWKPGFPKQVIGFSQNDKLYADAKLWLNKGWVDYWTPQLYWSIAKPQQSYVALLQWWIKENTRNRHIWPGLYTGKFAGDKCTENEIPYQIEWTRILGGTGNAHFSMKCFMQNKGEINDILTTKGGVYEDDAIVPAFSWLDDEAPAKPSLTIAENKETTEGREISWKSGGDEKAWLWAVRTRLGNQTWWKTSVRPAEETTMTLTSDEVSSGAVVVVSVFDRNGNESPKATLKINGQEKEARKD